MKLSKRTHIHLLTLGAVSLGVLFSLVMYNISYFRGLHSHILPDGRIVAHSHPCEHNGKEDRNHDHTSNEFVVHSCAGQLLQAYCFEFYWQPRLNELRWDQPKIYANLALSQSVTKLPSSRAPPHLHPVPEI